MTGYESHHVAGRRNSDLVVAVPAIVHRELTALQLTHQVPLSDRAPSSAARVGALLLGAADLLDLLATNTGWRPTPSFAELVARLLPGCPPLRVRTDLGRESGELSWSTSELLTFLHALVAELVVITNA